MIEHVAICKKFRSSDAFSFSLGFIPCKFTNSSESSSFYRQAGKSIGFFYEQIQRFLGYYLGLITNINEKSLGNDWSSKPPVVFQELKTFNLFVLQDNSDCGSVPVRSLTKNEIGTFTLSIETEFRRHSCSFSILF